MLSELVLTLLKVYFYVIILVAMATVAPTMFCIKVEIPAYWLYPRGSYLTMLFTVLEGIIATWEFSISCLVVFLSQFLSENAHKQPLF